MTEQQEKHLSRILEMASTKIEIKYRRGQAEREGNLFDLNQYQLLESAIDEAIDQVVYLLTLRDKLSGINPKDLI